MKTHTSQKFVVGNWKMHTTSVEAEQLANGIIDGFDRSEHGVFSAALRNWALQQNLWVTRAVEACMEAASPRLVV